MAAEPRWPAALFRLAQRAWPGEALGRDGVAEAAETFARRVDERIREGRSWRGFVLREVMGAVSVGVGARLAGVRARRTGRRRGNLMEAVFQDVRFCVRALGRSPSFAFLVVLVLALGVGANTAIFSVVNAVLLRPLPVAEPDRLVTIRETNPEFGWEAQVAAPANLLDWRNGVAGFEDVAGYLDAGSMTLTGEGDPELVRTSQVTGTFFDVLGIRAALGRVFRDAETWSTESPTVVLSDGFWARRFGRDPTVIGRMLTLNGVRREVVGVTPPGFAFPAEDVDAWTSVGWAPENRTQVWFRRAHFMNAVARLAPGVTPEQADAQLQVAAQRLSREYPETNEAMGAHVHPLHAFLVRDVRTPLLLLLGAVILLLLVACANAGNLMLVRATGRSRELAVRAALGAGSRRIARLVLTESMLLSLAGGALGIVLGVLMVRGLGGLMPATLPSVQAMHLDMRVLAFAAAMTLAAGTFFGAWPAWRAARTGVADALREGGRGSSQGRRALRASSVLVVAETALALVLVLGAGLLVRSFVALRQVDPGFAREGRVIARIGLPAARYDSSAKMLAFYDRLLERLRNAPGISASALSHGVPLLDGPSFTTWFVLEGWTDGRFGAEVSHQRITPGWFAALDIDVIAGRAIDTGDRPDTEPVLLINQSLRRQFFEDRDPIGRRIAFEREPGPETTWWRIIGVVEDVHQYSIDSAPMIEVYKPVAQDPAVQAMYVVVHGTRPPAALIGLIRSAVSEIDADIPLASVLTLDEVYARSLRQDRFLLALLSAFAALAALLAALGVYGVSSHAVRRRTNEIGVRVALGAQRSDVLRLILRQSAGLIAAGTGFGLAGGLVLTRVLGSVLYGVATHDPLTFAVVPLLLAFVGLAATWLPARSATRLDPLIALRRD